MQGGRQVLRTPGQLQRLLRRSLQKPVGLSRGHDLSKTGLALQQHPPCVVSFCPRRDDYDSQIEDAQNPSPEPEDEQPKKTGATGAKIKRTCEHIQASDTQETLAYTPPTRRMRAKSQSFCSVSASKVHAALRRPGTVDMEASRDRKERGKKATQRSLSKEFAEAKAKSKELAAKEASKGQAAGNKREQKPAGRRKLIDLGDAPKKPRSTTKEDKRRQEADKKDDAYFLKDHDTASSSNSPFVPAPGKQRTACNKVEDGGLAEGSEKPQKRKNEGGPDVAKADKPTKKASKPKVEASSTRPQKPENENSETKQRSEGSGAASTTSASPKSGKDEGEINEKEKKDKDEVSGDRKLAHKLYMRFWRNIQSPNLRHHRVAAEIPAHDHPVSNHAPLRQGDA